MTAMVRALEPARGAARCDGAGRDLDGATVARDGFVPLPEQIVHLARIQRRARNDGGIRMGEIPDFVIRRCGASVILFLSQRASQRIRGAFAARVREKSLLSERGQLAIRR